MPAQREHWGTKLGFIMATAGSAIGLGSLWRFPYLTGENGGGAFVLLYILFTLLIGIPIFISELIAGRASQKSAIQAFMKLAPRSNHWHLAGWLNIFTALIILSYYSVVSGWTLNYALMSLLQFTQSKTPDEIRSIFDILYVSADINVFWHFIFMVLTAGIVYGGIRKGIEYWSKILTPALLIILIGLFLFAITLPGFKQACNFILYPDFSKLTPNGILEALGMSLFTMSIGIGAILTYGSYMQSDSDIPKTSLIIGSVSAAVSLIGVLIIFPIIFTFGFAPEEGTGLVFKTLPVLFTQLPGTLIISTVFFILFIFTALTSSISILEVIVSNLIETLNWSRKKSVIISSITAFLLGIPTALAGSGLLFGSWKKMYGKDFFTTLDYLCGSWLMPLGGFFIAIFVGFIMKKSQVKEEFLKGTTMNRFITLWLFLIRWLVPIAVFIIILEKSNIININNIIQQITGNKT